jgi:ankyrin repeat protein
MSYFAPSGLESLSKEELNQELLQVSKKSSSLGSYMLMEMCRPYVAAGADVCIIPEPARLGVLCSAISNCQTDFALKVIASGLNVNAHAKGYAESPIHQLAASFDESVYEALKAAGADLNTRNDKGNSLLHQSCERGQRQMARNLARDGALHQGHNKDGFLPIHLAAIHGYAHICQDLVEAGIDPNALTKSGQTPLIIAAGNGHRDACMALIDCGADPMAKFKGQSVWAHANRNNHRELGGNLKALTASLKAAQAIEKAMCTIANSNSVKMATP